MYRVSTALAAVVAALLAVPFGVVSGSAPQEESTTRLAEADLKFIKQAAREGIAELSFGQICLAKASDDNVRRFAKQILDEQQQANQELKRLARSKGVFLPMSNDQSLHRKLISMMKHSGSEFDRAFSEWIFRKYERDLTAFERHKRESRDAELRAWIEKVLPALRVRYQTGYELAVRMGIDVPPVSAAINKPEPR